MTLLFLLLFWGLKTSDGNDHDIHVSVNEIQIDENGVEILVKTFLNDLQSAMGLEAGAELPEDYTNAEDMLEKYLQSQIQITWDQKALSLHLEDVAPSMDAVWITLKAKQASKGLPKLISIQHTLLTDIYSDQTNILNVKWPNGKNSAILNQKKSVYSVEID